MYSVYYPVPRTKLDIVKDIRILGRRTFRVDLHIGYCYKDNGSHSYLIDRYALFNSFDFIERCGCISCILKRSAGT